MDRAVRFRSAELAYGCHHGRFELPEKDEPVVIYGPNGAGKSTLLEAIVRAIYGFNRRSEGARLEGRKPWWEAVTFRSSVELSVGDERWLIDRDFVSAEVMLERLDPPGKQWVGDGNPGASNAQAREYRERLRGLIGIPERDGYESTACVHQGELVETRLGEHLLRVAAGGHTTVEEAKERIQEAYRGLTAEPIRPGDRRLPKARPLDEIEEELRALRGRLLEVETAEARRAPLVREQEEAEARLETVKAEIGQLEGAQEPLTDRRALEADAARIRERIQPLEAVLRDLGESLQELKRSAAAWEEFEREDLYPDDFSERVAVLRALWETRDGLRHDREMQASTVEKVQVPTRAGPIVAAVVGLLGVAAAVAGWLLPGLAAVVVAAIAAAALLWRRQRRVTERRHREEVLATTEARLDEAEAEVRAQLEALPHGATLTPETLPDRREAFDRQRRARESLELARSAVRPVVRRGAEMLGRDPQSPGNAEEIVRELETELSKARNQLAERSLALERSSVASLDLPDGVEADPNAVRRALQSRRSECDRLEERRRELHKRLVSEASPPESAVAIRDRLEALERRRDELRVTAEAHRRAHALLSDAYEEFRARDQDRLLENVSARLLELTEGRIGPFETSGGLAEAHVTAHGRAVVPESPPLSYGELHAVLLAIRLGASDFLAKEGLVLPLVIDEPFAHLDEDRSLQIWRLLQGVAASRQVIITTHSALILERLGVDPDISLERQARRPAGAAASSGADII